MKGGQWEAKFADHASIFTRLGEDFKNILRMYTAHGVQSINRTMGHIEIQMEKLMKKVFSDIVSPEEQELLTFIKNNGGADKVTEDDKVLMDLIRRRDAQVSRTNSNSLPKELLMQMEKGTGAQTSFAEIKAELRMDLETILEHSRKHFDQRFDEQKKYITELGNKIERESSKIIAEFKAGAHQKIRDEVSLICHRKIFSNFNEYRFCTLFGRTWSVKDICLHMVNDKATKRVGKEASKPNTSCLPFVTSMSTNLPSNHWSVL